MAESRPACAGLWNTPMVHVDGDVTTCCLDEHLENKVGNLRSASLAQIWHGDKMNAWRVAHIEGRFAVVSTEIKSANERTDAVGARVTALEQRSAEANRKMEEALRDAAALAEKAEAAAKASDS